MTQVTLICIKTETIRLSQFLKLSNIIQNGAEAKSVLQNGLVYVNGEIELRRGRKLKPDDSVTYKQKTYQVKKISDL